jgi:hypothetical protein
MPELVYPSVLGIYAIAHSERSRRDRFADYLLPFERLTNKGADSDGPLGGINDHECWSGRDVTKCQCDRCPITGARGWSPSPDDQFEVVNAVLMPWSPLDEVGRNRGIALAHVPPDPSRHISAAGTWAEGTLVFRLYQYAQFGL